MMEVREEREELEETVVEVEMLGPMEEMQAMEGKVERYRILESLKYLII